jgi:hypothetical protein
MLNKVLFRSQSCDYRTPVAIYKMLDNEFHFDDDPCGLNCDLPLLDGLNRDWGSMTFLNPPYGTQTIKWLKKAYEQYQQGKTIICLVASRTDTKWWHEYCMKATEIRFIRGRLKFGTMKFNAPFPSAIVIFK